MERVIKLSVHQLVDFLLRVGDIDNRVFNKATMQEGTAIHSYYQAKQGNEYLAEYYLKETFEVDDFKVTIDGRADGIIIRDDKIIIDEIKSTIVELEDFFEEQKEWHLGQAKCYALMYAHEKNLDKISVQLTYIHQLTRKQMIKTFNYETKNLELEVNALIKEYIDFYKGIFDHIESRNNSAKQLKFPFEDFRSGQKSLAKYSFGIAKKGGFLFCEAPTGIGKTISTLFPYVKSWAETDNEKIFYLTAKNSGKEAAFNTVAKMVEAGLDASDILITAKEKVCLCPGKACNPDECPYAKGYYTSLRRVLKEALKNYDSFNKDIIKEIAIHNGICPFEFSLDLSLFVDIIICDYNYFFDPMVYLRRYFDEDAHKHMVLVDEAHNLVERGRGMYSAFVSYNAFKEAKKAVRHLDHKKIKSASTKLGKVFKEYEELPMGETVIPFITPEASKAIEAYLLASTDVNKNHHSFVTDEFKEFFFELNKFNKIIDFYDENFCLYITRDDEDTVINLLCLDPSRFLRDSMNMVKSKVIFSATLSPIDYYLGMMGGQESDPMLMLPSPFPKDNLCLMVAPNVSLRYKNRNSTIKEVAQYIKTMVLGKTGNYFVFLPSFEYMDSIIPYLASEDYVLIAQDRNMDDESKEQFLSLFVEKPERTMVGLAVVGGAFGEGVDLVSDRLIGVAVVGVGLPKLCFERDRIREYFDSKEGKGYEYAYVDPGINKVMQAVGRVIRSETDRGVALLIDDRYLSSTYHDMFKNHWSNYKVVTSNEDINETVQEFWQVK